MGLINRGSGQDLNYVRLIVNPDKKKGPYLSYKDKEGKTQTTQGVIGKWPSFGFFERTTKDGKKFNTVEVSFRDGKDIYIISMGASPLSDEVLSKFLDVDDEIYDKNFAIWFQSKKRYDKDRDAWLTVKTKEGAMISTVVIQWFDEEDKKTSLRETLFDDRKFKNPEYVPYEHPYKEEYFTNLDLTKKTKSSNILNQFFQDVFCEYLEKMGWNKVEVSTQYQTGFRYQRPIKNDDNESNPVNDVDVDDHNVEEEELPFD